jgi:hypothetical protein
MVMVNPKIFQSCALIALLLVPVAAGADDTSRERIEYIKKERQEARERYDRDLRESPRDLRHRLDAEKQLRRESRNPDRPEELREQREEARRVDKDWDDIRETRSEMLRQRRKDRWERVYND